MDIGAFRVSFSPLSMIFRFHGNGNMDVVAGMNYSSLTSMLSGLVEDTAETQNSEPLRRWIEQREELKRQKFKGRVFRSKTHILLVYMPAFHEMHLRVHDSIFDIYPVSENDSEGSESIAIGTETLSRIFELSGLPDYTSVPIPESFFMPVYIAITKYYLESRGGMSNIDSEALVPEELEFDASHLPRIISMEKLC